MQRAALRPTAHHAKTCYVFEYLLLIAAGAKRKRSDAGIVGLALEGEEMFSNIEGRRQSRPRGRWCKALSDEPTGEKLVAGKFLHSCFDGV